MLENEYIENLVDKFTNIINEANHAKELYVTLGQKYAEGEKNQTEITNASDVNRVQDLEDELNRINNTTYASYAEMVNGAPTEEEFQEWKNARVEALQNLIEEEKVRRAEDVAHMENAMYDYNQDKMDTASEEYDKAVDELKKHVEKINTQIERTIKRIQIRIDELDEEIADIVDELRETNDHEEKIRLSKELENYRTMKVSYESNLAAINEIKTLPNEISNSIEDYEKIEELLQTATEKVNEVNGRISRATDEIEVNVSYNEQTGKYVVECSSGNFKLSPGKEYSEEELTRENIGKLLKGFVGALANNRVSLYKNGKMYMKTSFENAASNIVEVAKDMDKTIEPHIPETPEVEAKENTSNNNSGMLTEEEITTLLDGMNSPTKDQSEPDQPEINQPEIDQPEIDQPEPDQPESDRPEIDQPEIDQPEIDQPEIDQPEIDQPEPDQPEIDQPEIDQPESDQPEIDQPEIDQPEPDQPEPDQPESDQPEIDQPEIDQPEPDQPETKQLKPDVVVKKVIKTRNLLKNGVAITGSVATFTATAIAGISLYGIVPAALAAYGAANAIIDGAAAFKSYKVRKSLSSIADKHGLIVKVDKDTKSVYFCVNNDLSTKITSEDLSNPNPEVRKIAEALQADLDQKFENDKRNLATPEQMKEYEEKIGFITQKPPLEYCQKVTLDNVEAAYQQIGGVYSIHDRKKFNAFGKTFTSFFKQDEDKIATDFSNSMQPEKSTEVIDVDFKEIENLENDKTENKEENMEENKEETEEKASSQQNPDDKNEQQNPEEKENEEQKEETIEPELVEEEKTSTKDSQEETPSAFADVDVDDIDNSKDLQRVLPNEEELKNFTSGITVGDNLNANSSRIHEEYEKMSAELENSENLEVEEEKGRTL